MPCFQPIIRDATGQDAPQDPREQLHAAVLAVFGSWNTDSAFIHFFASLGTDHGSCSPFRVPVARLEGATAALARRATETTPTTLRNPR